MYLIFMGRALMFGFFGGVDLLLRQGVFCVLLPGFLVLGFVSGLWFLIASWYLCYVWRVVFECLVFLICWVGQHEFGVLSFSLRGLWVGRACNCLFLDWWVAFGDWFVFFDFEFDVF